MTKTKTRIVFAFLFMGLLGAAPAFAVQLPEPRAAYAADCALMVGTQAIASHVNADGPKERRIFDLENGSQTVLVRRDINKVYMLISAINIATEIDLASLGGGMDLGSLAKIPGTPEGSEIIAGERTTRYKVNGKSDKGSFDGHVWSTADGMIVKVDGTATAQGKPTPFTLLLSNIKRGLQAPSLFEVPSTMKIMPFDMSALLGGAKSGQMALPMGQ